MSELVSRRIRLPAAVVPCLFVAIAALAPAPATAQQPVVRANWPLADRFTNEAMRPFIYSTSINPRWINETDVMWYSWRDRTGTRWMVANPATRQRQPMFDHQRMAEQLSEIGRKPREAHDLNLTLVSFNEGGRAFRFVVDSVHYEFDLRSERLSSLGRLTRQQMQLEQARIAREGVRNPPPITLPGQPPEFRNYSPDSTAFAFAREHNLFVVEVATGDTLQVSTDGEQWYSFGARDTTQTQQQDDQLDQEERQQQQARSRDPRVRANVTWSPDSRAFSVVRTDSRKVSDLFLVNSLSTPRPTLMTYKYAMPGEENVAQLELFTYRRGEPEIAPVDVAKWRDQRLFDVHWTTGSSKLRLVRRDRLQRNMELIEVDLPTRATRVLLTESVEDAFLERQNVRYIRAGGDFVWFSERTGWGHFYLYDHNGNLKNPITSGPWRAEQVMEVDSVRRVLWIAGVGRERGENPYYRHTYRVNADGSGLALLDAGDANHATSLSPSKRFLVDTWSRVDMAPKVVIRDDRGGIIMELEETDVGRLAETGWRPPETFTVKAADGVTDIYGVMWRPFDFDPTRRYPIIAHVYPGPQTETVTTTFSPTATNQRLAQLGFIVIQIGNRGGNPSRSNAYHSFGYYNLRDYGLADKKSGIEQLAARHSWIDIDRVGIYGHSGGGFMTAAALMLPPYNDFFKVGVSSAGNHDNNVYNQNWSEQHHGLREDVIVRNGEGDAAGDSVGFKITVPTNHELAANLRGRLLLVHGDMDNNVHPAGTVRLADALIKANKRFDFMIMPGQAHGFGPMQNYFTRMMYEYFAEHLMGDYYRAGAEMR
jgi:dipeptidyl-peptidase 4